MVHFHGSVMQLKSLPKLTEAEFEIMKVIWANKEATINEIVGTVNTKRDEKLQRTTIQVQLSRLEEKGWLAHREEKRVFYYKATREREKTQADIVRDVKNRIFDGSCSELIKSLFDSKKISSAEIYELRNVLKQFDGRK